MSDPDIYASEQVLAVVRRLTVPNIEQVARSAGLARVTAKKYLDELVAARTIKEARCGNSKVYLLADDRKESTNSSQPLPGEL